MLYGDQCNKKNSPRGAVFLLGIDDGKGDLSGAGDVVCDFGFALGDTDIAFYLDQFDAHL